MIQKRWALLRRSNLSILRWLGEIATAEKVALYLVGGAVRDKLLGKKTLDLDLACEGNAKRLGNRLGKELNSTFTYYPPFLTGTLQGPADERIDIARTRRETYPKPGKLPVVQPASIEEDLHRRDFTVNAMAYSLAPTDFGRLIDPIGGEADLSKGIIRILYDASFVDDPTRVFRAVRYAERLGFRIQPHTLALLQDAIPRISALSGERLLYELQCIAREANDVRTRTIKKLERLGALGFLGKPLALISPARLSRIKEGKVCEFLCLFFSSFSDKYVRKLPVKKACLLTTRTLRETTNILSGLNQLHKPSSITSYLNRYDVRGLQIISQIRTSRVCAKINVYLTDYCEVKIKTTGHDLKRMGIPEGPRYRKLLNNLLAAKLDGRIKTKREELIMLKHLIRKS